MTLTGRSLAADCALPTRNIRQQSPACTFRESARSPSGLKRKRQAHLVTPAMVAAQEAPTQAAQGPKLRVLDTKSLNKAQLSEALLRPRIDFDSILHTVQPIVQAVKDQGDQAVKQFTQKFDRVKLDTVCSPIQEFGEPELPAETVKAFETAFNNIHKFHTAQKQAIPLQVETMPGVQCRRLSKPIAAHRLAKQHHSIAAPVLLPAGAVGIYVPGGTAVLPSSALMLSVPAGIAGCKTIVLATPPRPDGSITPEVLWCAKRAGVTHILKAGGAQAVAAMAWGTETCPKVYKILGPGNQYVTAAKMALQNSEAMISMDMPAGPSEVLVIADASARPSHVAADLLSQAEHGPDSQVVLLALPGVDLEAVNQEVAQQCAALPRSDAASQALSHSCVVSVGSKQEAADLSNLYAPEHLIINVEDAEDWLPLIDNAGSVFLGRWTPESVGDYASGTNHVLPTYGYARMYSGVSLDSFQKGMTVQSLSKQGLQNLGPTVAHMADLEGLTAHQRAVTLRLQDLQQT